jgi:adenine-specific DNA-methyltransferase
MGVMPREGKQWQIGEDTARDLEARGRLEIIDGIVKRAVYPED